MPRSSLREQNQLRIRQQIVDAAYALFEERGFTSVSVTDIAERAAVGRTTFFRHFGDKQEVLFADEQRLVDRLSAAARAVDAPCADTVAQALAQLEPIVADLCAIVTESSSGYRRHEQLVASTPELQDRRRRKQETLIDGLEELLVERGTARPLAVLAAQVAGACYFAGRRLAGVDSAELVHAVRRAFAMVEGPRYSHSD